MKNFFVIFFICTCSFAATAQKHLVVDANASVRNLNGTFNAIKVSGGIDVYISQSAEIALAVSALQDDVKENLKTVIEGDVLKIFYESNNNWKRRNSKLRVYVSCTSLKKIEASVACNVILVDSLQSENLNLQISGASQLNGKFNVDNLDIKLSGASDLYISGIAKKVNMDCSGASDVHGFDLQTDDCDIIASGASDISITVNNQLVAKATGASEINYKGAANITKIESSGASSIQKEN